MSGDFPVVRAGGFTGRVAVLVLLKSNNQIWCGGVKEYFDFYRTKKTGL